MYDTVSGIYDFLNISYLNISLSLCDAICCFADYLNIPFNRSLGFKVFLKIKKVLFVRKKTIYLINGRFNI